VILASLRRWLSAGACVVATLSVLGQGCAGNEFAATEADASLDAPSQGDTGQPDRDVPHDAQGEVSPPVDAPIPPADSSDARQDVADSGLDAADAQDSSTCAPTTCPPLKFECVPEAAATGSGLSMSSIFYVAWRFQVPAGRTLVSSEIGALIRPTVASGNLFATIIPLASPTTTLKPALTESDVLGSGIISLNGVGVQPRVFSVPLSVTLAPGWYAVAFGTNMLGASGADASIEGLTDNGCNNGQFLLSVRYTGENIAQSSGGHLYVLAR